MRVDKRKHNSNAGATGGFFFRYSASNNCINLSSEVRDIILPHSHVFVDVSDGNVILTPTDDESAYKLILKKGSQACVTWCYADKYCTIPKNMRVYGFAGRDGTAIFPIHSLTKLKVEE